MSKIFSHASNAPAAVAASNSGQAPAPASGPITSSSPTPAMPAPAAGGQPSAATAPAQPVDVAAVLDQLAAKNSEKLDWKHSIVDLMKLVGMDSSFSARKELAQDLHYSGDTGDSAAMNVWLHQEVMQKLAANGAKIPQDLLKK